MDLIQGSNTRKTHDDNKKLPALLRTGQRPSGGRTLSKEDLIKYSIWRHIALLHNLIYSFSVSGTSGVVHFMSYVDGTTNVQEKVIN